MKELISVIIPVYNCGGHIERCVNSVLKQTYSDIEIILINDGSTDDSAQICKKLEKQDGRIKYTEKVNTGVSDTRNLGLSLAMGEYVSFVDCDDWIDKNMLQTMLDACSGMTEMVFCPIKKGNEQKEIVLQEDFNALLNKNLSCFFMYGNKNVMGSCWRILFKKEFIIKNELTFNKNIYICEDLLFVIKAVKKSCDIKIVNGVYYHYFTRENSCLNTKTKRFYDGINLYYYEMKEFLVKENPELCCLLDFDYINILIPPLLNENKYRKKVKIALRENEILNSCFKKENIKDLYKFYFSKKERLKIRLLVSKKWFLFKILSNFNKKIKRGNKK